MSFPLPWAGYVLAPLAAMITAAALAGPASTAADPQGVWLTEGKDAVLAINRCGRRLCGRILWLQSSRDKTGKLRVDVNNPDPSKQTRLICGLTIISSLRYDGEGAWEGYIYDPKDGQTYSGTIAMLSPDSLRVRAYSIFRLLGRSETWTRLPTPTAESLERECRDGKAVPLLQEADADLPKSPAAGK
jgi:uncharacterized protein (DUF2147 family)